MKIKAILFVVAATGAFAALLLGASHEWTSGAKMAGGGDLVSAVAIIFLLLLIQAMEPGNSRSGRKGPPVRLTSREARVQSAFTASHGRFRKLPVGLRLPAAAAGAQASPGKA